MTKKRLIATLPLLTLPKLPIDKVITAANDKLPKGLKRVVSDIPKDDWDIKTWQPDQREAMASAVEHWKDQYLANGSTTSIHKMIFSSTADDTEFKSQLPSILPRATADWEKTEPILFIDGSRGDVNPAAIERILTANKVIEAAKSDQNEIESRASSADLRLNTRFANDIQAVYSPIRLMSHMSTDVQRLPAANSAIQEALADRGVAATLLINIGEAGLGQPLPFTAKDKSLSVEPSQTQTRG